MKAQSGFWLQKAGGQTQDEALDIATDAAGNTYSTGYFTGSAAFGSSSLVAAGQTDIFVMKHNSVGTQQWVIQAGGAGPDKGVGIAVDDAGNCYVTGFFSGTANFGTTSVTAAGNEDVFVAHYDLNGALQWVTTAGGALSDFGNAVALDASGNVLVTGQFRGSAAFGTTNLTSQNSVGGQPSIDVFTAKLNGAGTFQWTKQGAAPDTDRGLDVAADAQGNVYVTGQFSDTITFDQVHNNNLLNAIFLVQYDAAGNEQWFRRIGAGSQNIAYGIAVSDSAHVYLTGDFLNNLFFFGGSTFNLTSSYTNNVFVAKYNDAGGLLWAVADGSDSPVSSRNIWLDDTANVYIVGTYQCRFDDYSDQYGEATFNSVGYNDVFAAKYTTGGSWQWARSAGGQQQDFGAGIAVNPGGEVCIAGSFNQRMNFAASPAITAGNFSAVSVFGPNYSVSNFPFAYCGDPNYGTVYRLQAAGNSDAFVCKPFPPGRLPYDYYKRSSGGTSKAVVGVCINDEGSDTDCGGDSLVSCGSTTITAATNTAATPGVVGLVGPEWNYLWSNGATNAGLGITGTNWYTVTITSDDGCFSSTDSIHVTINPGQSALPISDDAGVNTVTTTPAAVDVCEPDSVVLTGFSNGSPHTYFWGSPGGPAGADTVISVTQSGVYSFVHRNAFGCEGVTSVSVNVLPLPMIDSVLGDVQFYGHPYGIDTLPMCEGDAFGMFAVNLLLPSGSGFEAIGSDATVDLVWTPTINMGADTVEPININSGFLPDSSGWYEYDATITVIQGNVCLMDTQIFFQTDSVYIDMNPQPQASISINAPPVLCPADTVILSAGSSGSGSYLWSSFPQNAFLGPNDTSFIRVYQPGTYSVSDTAFSSGCYNVATASVALNVQPSPTISMDPADGTICPGDSVTITCDLQGTYQWFGPQGSMPPNQSILAGTPGFYFCVLTDNAGCDIVSNTVELTPFATPLVVAVPDSVICPGETVSLSVNTTDTATINWLPPLSGTGPTNTATQPGTYEVSVDACGITTIATITIGGSAADATIIPSAPVTGYVGNTLTLTGQAGMASYIWQPGNLVADSIEVTAAGTYILEVTDNNGCTDIDSIVVPESAFIEPPVSSDTTICSGAFATLSATGTGTLVWYDSPVGGTAIIVGTGFVTPILTTTTTYYVENQDQFGVASIRVPVTVFVIDPTFAPPIYVNQPVCEGDTLTLTTDTIPNTNYSWTGPGLTSTDPGIVIPNVQQANAGTYTLEVSTAGCNSLPATTTVTVTPPLAPPAINANLDSLCVGDTLELTTDASAGGYLWTGPNSWTDTVQSPVIPDVTLADSGMYLVQHVTTTGCGSEPAMIEITVLEIPASPVAVIPDSVCEGDTLILSTQGDPGGTYSWTGPGGQQFGQPTVVIPATTQQAAGMWWVEMLVNGCANAPVSGNVLVNTGPPLTIVGDTMLCVGDSLLLAGDVAGTAYNWTGPNGFASTATTVAEDSATLAMTGVYDLTVSTTSCPAIDRVLVLVDTLPVVSLGNDTAVCSDSQTDVVPGGLFASYLWSDGSTGSILPGVGPGTHWVVVTNDAGCEATDTVTLTVQDCFLRIPNVITPNGDGINDAFYVEHNIVTELECHIFNRFGLEVYAFEGANFRWDARTFDGQQVPAGVYFYVLDLVTINGDAQRHHGTVQVLH